MNESQPQRLNYLAREWSRYQEAPCHAGVVHGRLRCWTKELSGYQMSIEWNGQEHWFKNLPGVSLGYWCDGQFVEHVAAWPRLRAGDVVCGQKNDDGMLVQLLAPYLRDQIFQGLTGVEDFQRWSRFLRQVRDHFYHENFIEVTTPSLVSSPGMEEHLDAFRTEFWLGSQKQTLFLPTSPEFSLKKFLNCGLQNLFEIKTCFRNNESGVTHRPEFQMLEWYRAFSPLQQIAGDIERLVKTLLPEGAAEIKFVHTSFRELFAEFLGEALRPDTSRDELVALCDLHQVHRSEDDSWNDLFFRLVLAKIEPCLAAKGAVFIWDYPPTQKALARINERGWTERFEFYWRGLEIANAYCELNDPLEQELRFREVQERRRLLGKEHFPIDESFLQAMGAGMPPSSGVALGLERLAMAVYGMSDIADIPTHSLTYNLTSWP